MVDHGITLVLLVFVLTLLPCLVVVIVFLVRKRRELALAYTEHYMFAVGTAKIVRRER